MQCDTKLRFLEKNLWNWERVSLEESVECSNKV